jgi:hypothetical protein
LRKGQTRLFYIVYSMGKKVVVAVRFELTTFAGALARKGSGQVSLPLHQPATYIRALRIFSSSIKGCWRSYTHYACSFSNRSQSVRTLCLSAIPIDLLFTRLSCDAGGRDYNMTLSTRKSIKALARFVFQRNPLRQFSLMGRFAMETE